MEIPSVHPGTARIGTEILPADLEGACRALEREFARLLFQKMREAAASLGPKAGAGFGRRTAESMLEDQWAELASRGDGLGVWRMLHRQLEPLAVKSGTPEADQRTKRESVRTEADRESKRGDRVLGLRVWDP